MKNPKQGGHKKDFQIKLGRWDFVYQEGEKKVTLPVEMLAKGEFLWEISKNAIKVWDPPFSGEVITREKASQILERIKSFVELKGKKIRVLQA